jgi:hypothetical protein
LKILPNSDPTGATRLRRINIVSIVLILSRSFAALYLRILDT